MITYVRLRHVTLSITCPTRKINIQQTGTCNTFFTRTIRYLPPSLYLFVRMYPCWYLTLSVYSTRISNKQTTACYVQSSCGGFIGPQPTGPRWRHQCALAAGGSRAHDVAQLVEVGDGEVGVVAVAPLHVLVDAVQVDRHVVQQLLLQAEVKVNGQRSRSDAPLRIPDVYLLEPVLWIGAAAVS